MRPCGRGDSEQLSERDNAKMRDGKRGSNGPAWRNCHCRYGEAMLTMQTSEMKRRIVREARRLLKREGRYAIHEMCLIGDDLDEDRKKEINQAVLQTIHVGVRALSISDWRRLMQAEGFEVEVEARAPMHLLEPKRLFSDEGVRGNLRLMWNIVCDRESRERVLMMRKTFRRHQSSLAAVMMVCVKR